MFNCAQAFSGARHTVEGMLKHLNIRPLHDRVIVRRLEEGEQQVGGIIIPDSAKEKPQRGTVLSAGAGERETTASGPSSTSKPAI